MEAWQVALGAEAALLALGLALFLPGQRRPPLPGGPTFAERYARTLAACWCIVLAVVGFQLLQPFATPAGIAALGPGLTDAARGLDAGLRALLAPFVGPELDAALAAVMLGFHPMMVVLAPLLWLLADEERAAKGVLAAFAAFLLLAVPLHFLLPVEAAQVRPFPFLPEVGSLLFPPGDDDKVPSVNLGLSMCVALAARRSRNARFRPVAFVYPALLGPALFYYGINGTVGLGTGVVVALIATMFAERATSVERIVHQRIDAKPERKMAIRQAAEALLQDVRAAADKRGLQVDPRLVGSVAKDTFLGHKVDIDAFVLFPPDTPRRALEEHGLALGREVLQDPEERFAEHPYLAGLYQGIPAEVVPAYKVEGSDQLLSAVDRTPFHTDYVLRKLEANQRREVRLLKQFLLGIGVYGAEAKVQGFSGYLAELLVLKHGTFRGVLQAGSAWKVGTLLALEPFEGAPQFPEPLVVIDPVDPKRNVASALSLEKLLLFQEAAKAYLREPRLSFFLPRPPAALPLARLRELLRQRGHALLGFTLEKPDILEDSLHAQLRKCAQALAAELERGGFKVQVWDVFEERDRAGVVLELESFHINEREVHLGPPVHAQPHADRFRAKWTGNPRALSAVTEERGRLMVARRREFTNAGALVRAKVEELDIGKDLGAVARAKGFEVLDAEACLTRLDKVFLSRFVSRAKPWER